MTKTEKIIERIKAGDSDEQIMKDFDAKAPFIKRCHTALSKQEPEVIPAPVVEDPEIGQPPVQMFDPAMMAQMMATFQAMQEVTKPKQIQLTNCSRHPSETVSAGQNCPHCLKQSAVDNERMKNSKILPPCPKCNESKAFAHGGVIRKTKKAHHYVCGQCEITYNIKGESTEWTSGKDSHIVQ